MKQSDKEKTDSRAAMQNKDFRQAINFAFDRMLMQRRQMVKMEQTVSYVTRLHQVTLSKLAIRTSVILSMKNCQLR